MKKILIAKQVSKTKWKVYKKYAFGKGDIGTAVIFVVSAGYVIIRSLVG